MVGPLSSSQLLSEFHKKLCTAEGLGTNKHKEIADGLELLLNCSSVRGDMFSRVYHARDDGIEMDDGLANRTQSVKVANDLNVRPFNNAKHFGPFQQERELFDPFLRRTTETKQYTF